MAPRTNFPSKHPLGKPSKGLAWKVAHMWQDALVYRVGAGGEREGERQSERARERERERESEGERQRERKKRLRAFEYRGGGRWARGYEPLVRGRERQEVTSPQ